jgi:hypothetical protein
MKRSPMKPGKGFQRAVPPRPPKQVHDFTAQKREQRGQILRMDDGRARLSVAVPKLVPVRHDGYRRLVALLPCVCCGIAECSQAAHPNTGKGGGTKTDDRLCFPLCCDRSPNRCHPRFDQEAMFGKAERRAIEPVWGERTRQRIKDLGLWPADLEWME